MSMRWDIQDQLSAAQAITTGTVVGTNSKKITIGADMSVGRKMGVVVMPTVTAAGDVVATSYEFQTIQATNAALTAGVVVIGSSGAIAGSAVKAGMDPIEVPFRPGSITLGFIGYRVIVVGGTNPTVTLDAYLVPLDEVPHNKFFVKAVNVLV